MVLRRIANFLTSFIPYMFTSKGPDEKYVAENDLAVQTTSKSRNDSTIMTTFENNVPVYDMDGQKKKCWLGWLKWSADDAGMLKAAETKILSYIKTAYRSCYVDVGSVVSKKVSDKIWTISLNEDSEKTPLVLLHGLASGVALWCLNLDAFAAKRPVYAIDVLGFGRSSRPKFSSDALEAEKQLVQSVEEWRRQMKLDKIILLGHSMGGFIAASYAIRYPERVKHLILADPWGFPEKPQDVAQHYNLPFWLKAVGTMLRPFNPLWAVRAAGPYGQWLIAKARPDIIRKFEPLLKDDIDMVPQYIFQCNAQTPSGESAFHAMMSEFGWAKFPIINRMDSLQKDVPITLIYGSRSWVDHTAGEKIKELRSNTSYVNLIMIAGAGHHVYADRHEVFNEHVVHTCELADTGKDVGNAVDEQQPTPVKSPNITDSS